MLTHRTKSQPKFRHLPFQSAYKNGGNERRNEKGNPSYQLRHTAIYMYKEDATRPLLHQTAICRVSKIKTRKGYRDSNMAEMVLAQSITRGRLKETKHLDEVHFQRLGERDRKEGRNQSPNILSHLICFCFLPFFLYHLQDRNEKV